MRSLLTFISVGLMLGCGGLGAPHPKIEKIDPPKDDPWEAYNPSVSDDGTVVAGSHFGVDTGGFFRWTQVGGYSVYYADVSSAFANEGGSMFHTLTPDGAAIYGTCRPFAYHGDRSPWVFVWTFKDGLKKIEGLDNPIALSSSADESTVFAIEGRSAGLEDSVLIDSIKRRGVTGSWNVVLDSDKILSGHLVNLREESLRFESNFNGSAFILSVLDQNNKTRSFFWKEGEGFQQIPVSAGSEQEGSVKAYAISRDGTCVVGEIQTSSNTARAFLWTRAGGMRELGVLPGQISSLATAANGNGSIVVGSCGEEYSYLFKAYNNKAFFWTEKSGIRDLQSYLEELGMNMDGWKLNEAVDISPDGKVIVGYGEYQGQASIFLITGLPPLTEAGPANPPLLTLVEGGPGSSPVTTIAFSLLILGWMAWYLGFRRKS